MPSRAFGYFLRSLLLTNGLSFAGIRFWTPIECRNFLAEKFGIDGPVAIRETLHLILAAAAEQFDDPVFLIGADQFRRFLEWSRPNGVLERTRLGVVTRPGFPRNELDTVLERLERPHRVLFLDIDPNMSASTDIRARLEAGNAPDGLVPAAVAGLIKERGLYCP